MTRGVPEVSFISLIFHPSMLGWVPYCCTSFRKKVLQYNCFHYLRHTHSSTAYIADANNGQIRIMLGENHFKRRDLACAYVDPGHPTKLSHVQSYSLQINCSGRIVKTYIVLKLRVHARVKRRFFRPLMIQCCPKHEFQFPKSCFTVLYLIERNPGSLRIYGAGSQLAPCIMIID